MQQIRSNFVTIPGLVLLFALALISAYLGIGLLFAVLAALFLLFLISRLWADGSLKKTVLTAENTELLGFPGDIFYIHTRIFNKKFLPVIWLSVDYLIEEGACISAEIENDAVFSWVMPYQKLSWREPVKAVHRGVYSISEAGISSGDGFGLSELSDTTALKNSIEAVVFPSLIPVDVSVILRKLTELEASSRGYYTDPTLIKNILPYSAGDSFKDLNWRILARQGELVVNKKEKLDALRMCLVLDIESCSYEEITESPSGAVTIYRIYKNEFEHMLSVAASVAEAAAASGAVCSLVIPGYGKREAEVVIPDDIKSQTEQLLRSLAAVDYSGGICKMPFDRLDDDYHSLGQLFCLTNSVEVSQKRFEAFDLPLWYISRSGKGLDHVIAEAEILK